MDNDFYAQERVKLVDGVLSSIDAESLVLNDRCGAVTTFCGRVRNHNEGYGVVSIVYEAYEEMALKVMAEIMEEADLQFQDVRSVVHHRIGALNIGDAAVVVAVAAPHRQITFEACAWIIDQLKLRVPIFKHEQRENGVVWVGLGP
jgi:molybdopterin synthase catalytic subunit